MVDFSSLLFISWLNTHACAHTLTRVRTHTLAALMYAQWVIKARKKLVKAHFGRDSGAFKAEAVLIMITFQCIH